jgi:hypothetical protein
MSSELAPNSAVARAWRAWKETVLAVRAADRAGILVRGTERSSWLNGLVTCDLTKLSAPGAAYGLVVEKKGRIQTDFYVVASADALLLAVHASSADAMLETLDHYLVMEDAELERVPYGFWLLAGPAALGLAESLAPPFVGPIPALGLVVVAAPEPDVFGPRLEEAILRAGGILADDEAWESVRIARGLPRFGVEVDATFYPQEAGLEKLAVAFDKGCYLGQEVVYMLENRGHVKKKLVPLEVDGDEPLAPGEAVATPEGAAAGEVKTSVAGPWGKPAAIAMIKWSQSKPGTELRAGGRVVRVRAFDPA